MAYYKDSDFISETQNFFNAKKITVYTTVLCNSILSLKITKKDNWISFNEKLKKVIEDFFSSKGINYVLPAVPAKLQNNINYTNARTYKDIIECLKNIKGLNVEKNLKLIISESQTEENENFNYWARIFSALNNTAHGVDWNSFLCCYSQLLITQDMSRLMLNWMIAKYSRLCNGGLESSLGTTLNNNKINYEEFRFRSSFLRLAYSLRVTDKNDIETSKKKAEDLFVKHFGMENYNPRSFIDMTYYYAILKIDTLDELEKILRKLSSGIIHHIFSDISEDNIIKFTDSLDIDKVKEFLDFNKYSLMIYYPLLQTGYTQADVYHKAEEKFTEMRVNYFNNDISNRETYTYEYYKDTVEPAIDKLKTDEFINWMISERRFYEGYYKIASHTRMLECNDYCTSIEEEYAYQIVQENFLSNLNLPDVNNIGNRNWKDDVINAGSRNNQMNILTNILDPILNALQNYSGKSQRILNASICSQLYRESLYNAIIDELTRRTSDELSRSDYLLKKFREYAPQEYSSKYFKAEIDNSEEDDVMISMRWDEFNPMRYQDVMLYMCLNTKDPIDMFNQINSTKGFDYYQK